jgi:hypothetical protein
LTPEDAALAKVEPFREQLKDRGVHPDRFARWVGTWPADHQSEVVRITAGKLPGLMGSAPGSAEAELLAASRMTPQEILLHQKSKER